MDQLKYIDKMNADLFGTSNVKVTVNKDRTLDFIIKHVMPDIVDQQSFDNIMETLEIWFDITNEQRIDAVENCGYFKLNQPVDQDYA